MPIYEYFCESCDHIFEKFQKITDSSNSICTKCNVNIAKRKISVSAFHLKGGGWFKDGYGKKQDKNISKDPKQNNNKDKNEKDKNLKTDKNSHMNKSEKKITKTEKNKK